MKNYEKYILNLFYNLLFTCFAFKVTAQPVANFTASTTFGCAPLIVNFTDNSTGNPTSWNWNLGNGTLASQQNPSTTFINPGVYTVTLTVSNATGTNSITKTEYIKVYGRPVAAFTVNDSLDCIPHACQFTDLSITALGNITSWEWNFDDGTSSTQQNPSHVFSRARNYNVSLKVTNSGGCFNVVNKLAYIKTSEPLLPGFSFSQPVLCRPPETIRFTNESRGPGVLNYGWDFGDGGTSPVANPAHTYTNGGNYTIKLFVSNNLGCNDTLVLRDTVKIRNNQTRINSIDTVCINTMMFFTNASVPTPLASRWLFDNNSPGFGATVARTWTTAGLHTVKLVSNFGACSDSATKTVTVLAPPTAYFNTTNTTSCSAPHTVNFVDSSSGAIYWLWDFGDNTTSTQRNPSHTYTSPGEYNVRLTVTNAPGCTNTYTRYRAVKIAGPVISIDTKEGGGCIPYLFRPYPAVTTLDGFASCFWDFGNGITSTERFPSVIYRDSGTYTVKLVVTTVGGCRDSVIIDSAVRTGNRPFVDFNLSRNEVCPRIDVDFQNLSIPSDKWLWYFGADTSTKKNPVHQFLDSGLYDIKLIAWNNGCKDSITKTDIIRALPGLARFRPVFNCSNKQEVYFKDSSIAPTSWIWSFGDGATSTSQNPTHTFANFQNYTVSLVTTSGICTNSDSLVIKIIDEEADFSASKTAVCKGLPLTFYANTINRDNIVKYVWDFGDGIIDSTSALDTIIHIYQRAGAFDVTLTITDINGCTSTLTRTGFIKVADPVAAFSLTNSGGCTNQTVTFRDSSTGSIVSWYWNFGDGVTRLYNRSTVPALVPHTYTTTGQYFPLLVVIDSAGCIDSSYYAQPIGIYQPIADFDVLNGFTCVNDRVTFQSTSVGENVSCNWTFGDGTIGIGNTALKQYTADGDYTPKLVVTDEFGCKDSITKTGLINVRSVVADFSVSDTVGLCVPFQVDFTNNSVNATSSWWEFGDGGYSAYPNPLYYYSTPGVYFAKLTAKRTNTCISTDSVRITINAPSGELRYNAQTGCAPITINLNVVTNDRVYFIWDLNDGTSFVSNSAAVTHTYTLPGNFVPRVILKDSFGCAVPIFSADTISLYNTKVGFSTLDSIVCDNEAVQFVDSSYSGSPVILRQWDFGDGTFSNDVNPLHQYNAPGIYTVKLYITTRYGCRDSLIKTNYVRVYRKPVVSITGNNASYCGASTINFAGNEANSGNGGITWKWNFSNGNTSLLQNTVQTFSDTGNYQIQLVAFYFEGCTDTATTSVRIHPLPNVFAGNDTLVCKGSSLQLLSTGAVSYTWRSAAPLSCTNCNNPTILAENDLYVYVTGRSNTGCEKTDSMFITVKKPFTLSPVTDKSICLGNSVELSVSGAERYTWSPSEGLSYVNINNPIAKPASTTTYTVVGSDNMNCFTDSVTVTVIVHPQPSVNLGADLILNTANPITLAPVYSADITTYRWTPMADLSCLDCPYPIASPTRNRTYKVEVSNRGGCTASDEINIFVRCDNTSISMPTAFSPNNDGRNDKFSPLGSGNVIISSFKVFNRFGQMVFINGNFRLDDKSGGWDGKYKGQDLPPGSYVYSIEFVCANNEVSVVNGSVVLVR